MSDQTEVINILTERITRLSAELLAALKIIKELREKSAVLDASTVPAVPNTSRAQQIVTPFNPSPDEYLPIQKSYCNASFIDENDALKHILVDHDVKLKILLERELIVNAASNWICRYPDSGLTTDTESE